MKSILECSFIEITASNLLIGKEISSISLNDDQSLLALYHPDGSHAAFETTANDYHETWFADIIGVNFLIGGLVLNFEHMELPHVDDGRTRAGSDNFFGLKIKTNKGYCDIVYRTSSWGGHYGGNMHQFKDDLPEGMVNITKDWSC